MWEPQVWLLHQLLKENKDYQRHREAQNSRKIELWKGFMPGKSDLCEGANACVHKSALICVL